MSQFLWQNRDDREYVYPFNPRPECLAMIQRPPAVALDIGCGSGADHELKFGIFVPDETVKNVAEDASIPILVVVDGTAYGPLDAGIQHADDGTAIIAAWEFDDGRVGDIVRAMLASSGTTRVEFLGKAAVFEAAGIEGVGGQVKTGCAI